MKMELAQLNEASMSGLIIYENGIAIKPVLCSSEASGLII